ncbi:MAG: FliI/YscN family ATPase [Desulfobacterota bacterium]|jgi:flagellum-specific ATP synthase|nr:FliI/YscN family ATPase [Thermodesulfobacteriota bacterium]
MTCAPVPAPWTVFRQRAEAAEPIVNYGRATQVVGLVVEGQGPRAAVGDMCHIETRDQKRKIPAEVVGFRDRKILLMPFGKNQGIEPGCRIIPAGFPALAGVGPGLLGRVIDGLGTPLDQGGTLRLEESVPLQVKTSNPVQRKRISEPLDVGLKAVNGLLTLGKGQRMSIMAGSGVGKSTLLGMMARHTQAELSVIALIGERGREVREFIEKDLGPAGLKRSVVVVATSDQPPLIRIRGAFLATAIAEYFRDRNKDVLFMMDSITRFAMAAREVGLAIGEPPTSKGYTPSVYAQLPNLLERVGTTSGLGSITGIYTVLTEADDINDPIADAVRSIADGHIVLSRDLAHQNHYPAIDVLGSISRVMPDITSAEHQAARRELVAALAVYKKAEDLIHIGAYASGSNPQIDQAIKKMPAINAFLQQGVTEKVDLPRSLVELQSLFP